MLCYFSSKTPPNHNFTKLDIIILLQKVHPVNIFTAKYPKNGNPYKNLHIYKTLLTYSLVHFLSTFTEKAGYQILPFLSLIYCFFQNADWQHPFKSDSTTDPLSNPQAPRSNRPRPPSEAPRGPHSAKTAHFHEASAKIHRIHRAKRCVLPKP